MMQGRGQWVEKLAQRVLVAVLARILSKKAIERLLPELIKRKSRMLLPDDALRMLFSIDQQLYITAGSLAVRYGNGVHPKHRHIQFHDFFIRYIEADDHVLDVGCGIGALTYSIAEEAHAQVVGIDYHSNNIQIAKERHAHPKITYIEGDIMDGVPEGLFTVVVLSNVLEHLNDRVNLLKLIATASKANRFLIRVPRFDRHWAVPLKKELGLDWRLDEDHKIEYTPETFEEEMTAANLQIQHVEYRWDEIWAVLNVC